MRSPIVVVVGLVAFGLTASACAEQATDPVAEQLGSATTRGTEAGGPGEAASSTGTAAPVSFGIGETASDGDWAVTVHQVIDPFAPDVGRPAEGHRWIEIDAEVNNVRDETTAVPSPLLCFRLVNVENNQEASVSLITPSSGPLLDGQVSVGESLRGGIVYEIPVEWSSLQLQFDCSQLGTPAAMDIG